MRNTECKINPEMKLREGDIVTIEKYLTDLNLYEIRYDNKSGLYPKKDIKISKKKGQEIKSSITNILTFLEPDKSVERRMKSIEREVQFQKYSRDNSNDIVADFL
jgi:hypothetical protein